MKFRNFFLPHPETHKKAHLISWQALAIYILIFLFLRFGIDAYSLSNPGVLGITSKIDQQEVIRLTNLERGKKGLTPVMENEQLNKAAYEKAKNMFEEDYWSHYSPSGKDPWGFIQDAGYKFLYAGENLARNFYTSDEVVAGWMASPSHKDNILNSRYKEIGIAVVEGVLKGQKTTLVVQEFGTQARGVFANQPDNNDNFQIATQLQETEQDVLPLIEARSESKLSAKPIVDPFTILKTTGISMLALLVALLLVDLYIIRKRAIYRISSRHLPHLIFLGIAANALVNLSPGQVL